MRQTLWQIDPHHALRLFAIEQIFRILKICQQALATLQIGKTILAQGNFAGGAL